MKIEKQDDIITIEVTKPENIKQEMYLETFENLYDVYVRKNRDYGNSWDKSIEKYGAVAGLVRIEDKMNRLENLLMNEKEALVNDETVIDTIEDAINYLMMLKMNLQ